MTSERQEEEVQDRGAAAPVLVLGLGNVLLCDDGVGPRMVEELRPCADRWGAKVELIDGGTLGLTLLAHLGDRTAVVILDAIARGAPAGTVHTLVGDDALAAPPAATTAHEGNAGDLLRAAALLGELPDRIAVIGVEPDHVATGLGLSPAVEHALDGAVRRAADFVDDLVAGLPPGTASIPRGL